MRARVLFMLGVLCAAALAAPRAGAADQKAEEAATGAVETVTPMLDPDGTWRVSGYFIK